APHAGAILDLQSDNKGLKLPSVSLSDTAVFQLSTNPSDAASAIGMTVYNTNDNTKGGRGQGIYTWNGTWIYSGGAPRADIPVNRIIITSAGNVNVVRAGETLKLTDSIVPHNASNKKVAWSVPWSSSLTAGKAVVNDTGLVTAVKPGSVTVRASAIDGSTAYRDFGLTIQSTGTATGISVFSENGIDAVGMKRTLQLIAAIEPESAYQLATWEVTEGSAVASVSPNGLVTAKGIGTAVVKATTKDGSGHTSNVSVTVTPLQLPADTIRATIGSGSYLTYAFTPNIVWMVENSKEGTATVIGSDGQLPGNYYYSYSQGSATCTGEWSLPTRDQCNELDRHLITASTVAEQNLWYAYDLSGYRTAHGPYNEVNSNNAVWTDGPNSTIARFLSTGLAYVEWPNALASVRCVKPKF
ncbi:MAG: Ig-like domain-containing protein, partial [Dysgonamonadaceae bacterium]|nr:Ig-like domain-containing protein [Dysgonamonadaceae bacterium]